MSALIDRCADALYTWHPATSPSVIATAGKVGLVHTRATGVSPLMPAAKPKDTATLGFEQQIWAAAGFWAT